MKVFKGVLSAALLLVGITGSQARTVDYTVPEALPSSASVLYQAPIGVSSVTTLYTLSGMSRR